MQCDRARDLIGAYRDDELAPGDRAEVGAHLETCVACKALLADYERIGQALVRHQDRRAPAGLAADIRDALLRAELGLDTARPAVAPVRSDRPASSPPWLAVVRQAAGLAAAALIAAGLTWFAATARLDADRAERDVLSAHIRSLLQELPVQIASTDQHTVRPWFAGRADFAPAVRDLSAEGFPLLGGRLDYVDGNRVGVVVYRRRLHVINLFMWPSPAAAESTPAVVARKGYTLVTFTRGGVVHWLASDLNAEEMRQFARLL